MADPGGISYLAPLRCRDGTGASTLMTVVLFCRKKILSEAGARSNYHGHKLLVEKSALYRKCYPRIEHAAPTILVVQLMAF